MLQPSLHFQVARYFLWACILLPKVLALTWCGKNYRKDQPVIPPGGSFPPLEELLEPDIAFRCIPRIQPYLSGDDCATSSTILVDTSLTYIHLRHSSPVPEAFHAFIPKHGSLSLIISGERFNFTNIKINSENIEFPVSLCHLQPRVEPYTMTCTLKVTLEDGIVEIYSSSASLSYLPEPASSSITKMDHRTGALLVKANGKTFEPIFPIGFYTNFGGYLSSNITVLDELKAQGFNAIHPVPPFKDVSALTTILDRMDEIGLYLIYDMRHSYQNLTNIAKEVVDMKDRQSLLLWYTADEPDGSGDSLFATQHAKDLISQLDGYHPVSIALNCADFFFEEYVSGADVVMPDVYTIGNNATFSLKYGTLCTPSFGCCGCDNCQGRLEDISQRLDETRSKLRYLGWDKTKFVWAVTQAFGGEEFWIRPPTGREWLAQAILSINHGARGIIPWIDPTPIDIKVHASKLAKILPYLTPYFFDENIATHRSTLGRLDIAFWKRGPEILTLAINLDDTWATEYPIQADDSSRSVTRSVTWIMREGVTEPIAGTLYFEPLGTAVFVTISAPLKDGSTAEIEHDEL